MKILIVRVSSIGDVIHTLPALFLLKAHNPHAQISWVVQKKAAHLLLSQPFLDKVWVLPDRFLYPQYLPATAKVIKEIRSQKWDAIIDFQGLTKTSLLLMFMRGKKYGFDWNNAREAVSSLLTHHHTSPDYRNIIQKNLALASSVLHDADKTLACPTIDSIKQLLYLTCPDAHKTIVKDWLTTANKITKFIALCPNTTWESKRWPLSLWQKLITILSPEYTLVLIGKDFGNDAATLAHYAQQQGITLHLVPRWDLLSTTYLLQQASLLIAPDTSFLHIADMLSIPAIGLFGPTSKDIHGPFLHTTNHAHALQAPCPHRYQKTHKQGVKNAQEIDCMLQITPEMVLEQIRGIFHRISDKKTLC